MITESLERAKKRFKTILAAGKSTKCPLCERYAKVYRWSLYGTATELLIKFYELGETTNYVESKEAKEGLRPNMTPSELRHWNLIEHDDAPRKDGGKSGWWRVTDFGEKFILGEVTIKKYVHVYDGKVESYSGPDVFIWECVDPFIYREMMVAA